MNATDPALSVSGNVGKDAAAMPMAGAPRTTISQIASSS